MLAKKIRSERGQSTAKGKAERKMVEVPSPQAVRETVESIVIAFVLAFLFRAFEAEAFVIPTGSMAPTLQGQHKDVFCSKCQFNYRVGASQEAAPPPGPRRFAAAVRMVQQVTCPTCGFKMTTFTKRAGAVEPTYNGDRILVSKFAYEFSDPERWDVIVFKYPGNAKMNYIKRLVGLPNEIIRIQHGDIFTQPLEATEGAKPAFRIARKPPFRLRAMLQDVHDNHHYANELLDAGWKLNWLGDDPEETSGVWKSELTRKEDGQVVQQLSVDATDEGQLRWCHYRNFRPTHSQWQKVTRGELFPDAIRASVVLDSYAYNTAEPTRYNGRPRERFNWVGDLAVECDVTIESDTGVLVLELLEGGRVFQCELDIASGKATLTIDGGKQAFDEDVLTPVANTDVKGADSYTLMFSNVDDQLLLWVDGSVVEFDTATTYPLLDNHADTDSDVRPVGLGARGAKITVDHLKVFRDVYYIAIKSPVSLYDDGPLDFELNTEQYFALGDNSPQSKDSRLWPQDGAEPYVTRDLLIGKALFIYWPHSRDDIFPFCPNIPRMKFVR